MTMKRISLAALLAAVPALSTTDVTPNSSTVEVASQRPTTDLGSKISIQPMIEAAHATDLGSKIKLKPMIEVACCTRPQSKPDSVFPPTSREDVEFIR